MLTEEDEVDVVLETTEMDEEALVSEGLEDDNVDTEETEGDSIE